MAAAFVSARARAVALFAIYWVTAFVSLLQLSNSVWRPLVLAQSALLAFFLALALCIFFMVCLRARFIDRLPSALRIAYGVVVFCAVSLGLFLGTYALAHVFN